MGSGVCGKKVVIRCRSGSGLPAVHTGQIGCVATLGSGNSACITAPSTEVAPAAHSRRAAWASVRPELGRSSSSTTPSGAKDFLQAGGIQYAVAPLLQLHCRRPGDPPDDVAGQSAKTARQLALQQEGLPLLDALLDTFLYAFSSPFCSYF